ncbi:MAG: hypothetical protein A3J60_02195 [Candidatus Pacebacteria bacterium RIFCSPHIGHO2_02_FULL_46_9]|nr:MAG: hypothetical protein A3J60_02195 [Candidatus Pacebacteria bacterium RIFCSPHIGHO2_02_FULL_46_9]
MKTTIFQDKNRIEIEKKIKVFINGQSDFLSGRTASSPRAVGDAIQSILDDSFGTLLGKYAKDFSSQFARRAMADLAFTDIEENYHVVDVKTHRLDTVFNMPNLTSVERLSRFYEDDKNHFDLLLLAYSVKDLHLTVEKVYFVPIEMLSWSCLTIGALGWGQIQIANSNKIILDERCSRKQWMINLCDVLLEFYPNEIGKIGIRIEHFKKIKEHWLNKAE